MVWPACWAAAGVATEAASSAIRSRFMLLGLRAGGS
jgi:hypothetical protein